MRFSQTGTSLMREPQRSQFFGRPTTTPARHVRLFLFALTASAALILPFAGAPGVAQELEETESFGQTVSRSAEEARHYTQCLSLSRANPKAALDLAVDWNEEPGGGVVSQHCLAIALIAVQNYSSAAEALEKIIREIRTDVQAHDYARDPEIIFTLLHQAGRARMLSNQNRRAEKLFTEALVMAPENTDLLVDRAIVRAEGGNYWAALDDLNTVIDRKGDLVEAYILRAAAQRMLEQPALALDDTERAMALEPRNPDALFERGMIHYQTGDLAAAREDWQGVLLLAPNSPLSRMAKENLRRYGPRFKKAPDSVPESVPDSP